MNYTMIINSEDDDQLDQTGTAAIKVCRDGAQILNCLRLFGWPSTIFISDDNSTHSMARAALNSSAIDDLAPAGSQSVAILPLDVIGKNSGLPNVWARPSQAFVDMTRSIVSHRVGNVAARVHKTDIVNMTNVITEAAQRLIDLQFMTVRSGVNEHGSSVVDCVRFEDAAAAYITIGIEQQSDIEFQRALDYVLSLKFFAKTDIMYAALAENFHEINRAQETDRWADVALNYKTIYCRPYSNFNIEYLFSRPGFFL